MDDKFDDFKTECLNIIDDNVFTEAMKVSTRNLLTLKIDVPPLIKELNKLTNEVRNRLDEITIEEYNDLISNLK